MPHIILKKTFKLKPGVVQVLEEKGLSLHGHVPDTVVQKLNNQVNIINFIGGRSKPVRFQMDKTGHYYLRLNHELQKYNEEDIVVAVFDAMETLGYTFRFQYDTSIASVKASGGSFTEREMFIFQKITAPASFS